MKKSKLTDREKAIRAILKRAPGIVKSGVVPQDTAIYIVEKNQLFLSKHFVELFMEEKKYTEEVWKLRFIVLEKMPEWYPKPSIPLLTPEEAKMDSQKRLRGEWYEIKKAEKSIDK